MSALRISRPGYETVLIPVDDGIPARLTTQGWIVRGARIEEQPDARKRHAMSKAAFLERRREASK